MPVYSTDMKEEVITKIQLKIKRERIFICDLLNDNVSSSDYTVSNDKIIN